MGRITIFTTDGCGHCTRVKTALNERGLPYTEISLTKYPQKRQDVRTLCGGRTSTPQVFFHNEYVGGADETLLLLEQWDIPESANSQEEEQQSASPHSNSALKRYQKYIAKDSSALLPELEAPPLDLTALLSVIPAIDDQGRHDELKGSRDDKSMLVLPNNRRLSVLEITELLKRILPRRRLKSKQRECKTPKSDEKSEQPKGESKKLLSSLASKTASVLRQSPSYDNVFTGEDAMKAISKHFKLNEFDTIIFGRHLQQHGIIHAISKIDRDQNGSSRSLASQVSPGSVGSTKSGATQVSQSGATAVSVKQRQTMSPRLPVRAQSFRDDEEEDKSDVASEFSSSNVVDFTEPNEIFRLQCYQEPGILNSYCLWPNEEAELSDIPPTADGDEFVCLTYVRNFHNLLNQIESECTSDKMSDGMDETRLDLGRVRDHELFSVFEEAVCALQVAKLHLMDDSTKIAFGINVYNLMIKYAFVKLGVPTTDQARFAFFSNVKFNVGGYAFSFNDWENGILRGNRKAPYGLALPFSRMDPRRALVVQKVDPRIHFSLNCGARSCPPVRVFSAKNLKQELEDVAVAFLEDDEVVAVSPQSNSIRLSKIFYWYLNDFVDRKSELPAYVERFLIEPKRSILRGMIDKKKTINVSFFDYDWSAASIENYQEVQRRRHLVFNRW